MFGYKLIHELAVAPKRAHASDAGYDICSIENIVIPSKQRHMIKTGLSLKFPNDCYCDIKPRSGLAFKYGIQVLAGVIDSGYTGEIKVILYNSGDEDFVVTVGDKIAQILLSRIYTPELTLIENLDATDRGIKGFGSTGK